MGCLSTIVIPMDQVNILGLYFEGLLEKEDLQRALVVNYHKQGIYVMHLLIIVQRTSLFIYS